MYTSYNVYMTHMHANQLFRDEGAKPRLSGHIKVYLSNNINTYNNSFTGAENPERLEGPCSGTHPFLHQRFNGRRDVRNLLECPQLGLLKSIQYVAKHKTHLCQGKTLQSSG